ncbi:MAG TPA: IPT/TIG domain-containing protein [Candidatus Udaeobacter sp.]|nr:IPT/TIG domain-containing protein [Candidatus Udaeobacter sp.]
MPLRLKFLICLTLLGLLAIIFLSSCGYNGCADVPVLTSISSTSATVGGPSFTMTLTGRHFHSDTIFFFGGTGLASTTVNATTMTATIDSAYILTPGTLDVWVTGIPGGSNLNGPCGGGLSAKLPFTIQ